MISSCITFCLILTVGSCLCLCAWEKLFLRYCFQQGKCLNIWHFIFKSACSTKGQFCGVKMLRPPLFEHCIAWRAVPVTGLHTDNQGTYLNYLFSSSCFCFFVFKFFVFIEENSKLFFSTESLSLYCFNGVNTLLMIVL